MNITPHLFDDQYDHTVLVLQGGGALGAYQAGVYEGLIEAGFSPDWVTGVSIGAINAALIAGNPPNMRVTRLREFWDRVSSSSTLLAPLFSGPMRPALSGVSAVASVTLGVPGFFSPRGMGGMLATKGSAAATSFYDTQPLKSTLKELVDFDLINEAKVRLSIGAVNIVTGNSLYFDNRDDDHTPLCAEHIMASGALPPAFAPVQIGDDFFWDGGIVSNTPLTYVLEEDPHMDALVVQVDLFSARGALPVNLDEVMERHKDIMYSSKTRFNTKRVAELQNLKNAFVRLEKKLPAKLKSDPDFKLLLAQCNNARIDIVHLINRRYDYTSHFKDYEFSRATVHSLWESGLEDVRASLGDPVWLKGDDVGGGMRIFDLTQHQRD